MSKLDDLSKVKILCDLLEAGQGEVDVSVLTQKTGSPRRARRALFVARKGGMVLEPVRNAGERGVHKYVRVNGDVGYAEVEAALVAKRKRKLPKTTQLVGSASGKIEENESQRTS